MKKFFTLALLAELTLAGCALPTKHEQDETCQPECIHKDINYVIEKAKPEKKKSENENGLDRALKHLKKAAKKLICDDCSQKK